MSIFEYDQETHMKQEREESRGIVTGIRSDDKNKSLRALIFVPENR